MISALLFASLATASPQAEPTVKPIMLNRVFKKGQTLTYSVSSLLTVEQRYQDLQTFLPRDQGYEYTFSIKVLDVDADGYARLLYDRPKTVAIMGEFGDQAEFRRAEEGGGFKLNMRISPTNELIEVEEVKPPAKPGSKPSKSFRAMAPQQITDAVAGRFLGDLYRLALMVGSLDSTLDFAPKLPFVAVKPGSTWKKTVGFSPQKSASMGGKQIVQRLDYTFTYEGIKTVDGKQVHRITGKLDLNNDMWPFLLEQYGLKSSDTPFKALNLNFASTQEYDLDINTLTTLRGTAKSSGSTSLELRSGTQAAEESKLTGTSSIKLVRIQ